MKKISTYLLLYFALLLYSLTAIASKLASAEPFLSWKYLLYMGFQFAILAIYAVLWQIVLKKVPLFIAFANKGMTIFLGMIFGYFIFHEEVTVFNILGTAIIAAGVIVMMTGELKQ